MPTSSGIFWNHNCRFGCNYVNAKANIPPYIFVLVRTEHGDPTFSVKSTKQN